VTSGTTVWVVVVVAMLTQMVGDLGVHVAFRHGSLLADSIVRCVRVALRPAY